MVRFSLKELFYWLTIWMVSAALLMAIASAPLTLFLLTLWLLGTVAVSKAFGRRVSFAYAVALGAISYLAFIAAAGPLMLPPRTPRYDWHLLATLLFGLISGPIVWLVTVAADETYKRLNRGRSS